MQLIIGSVMLLISFNAEEFINNVRFSTAGVLGAN